MFTLSWEFSDCHHNDDDDRDMAAAARLPRLTRSSIARCLSTDAGKTAASGAESAEQALSPEKLVDLRRRTRALGESGEPVAVAVFVVIFSVSSGLFWVIRCSTRCEQLPGKKRGRTKVVGAFPSFPAAEGTL
jgi:hypothetical protein